MTKTTQIQLDIPTDLYIKLKAIGNYEKCNWHKISLEFLQEACDKYPDTIVIK